MRSVLYIPASNRVISVLVLIAFGFILFSQWALTVCSFLPSSFFDLGTNLLAKLSTSALVVSAVVLLLLQIVIEAVMVPVFLVWFHCCYENLRKARIEMDYPRGGALGWWFVPAPNLFYPYQMAKEMWYKTQKTYTTELKEHGWVQAWWTAFWFSWVFILALGLNRIYFHSFPVTLLVITCVRTAAIVPTMVMVWRIHSFEKRFLTEFAWQDLRQPV